MRKRTTWLIAVTVVAATLALGAAAQVSRKEFDALTQRLAGLEQELKLLAEETDILRREAKTLNRRVELLEEKVKTLRRQASGVAVKEPATAPQTLRPDALDVGGTYRLSQRTPLLPRFESGAPFSEFAKVLEGESGKVKHVEAGGRIHIMAAQWRRNTPWYHVRATNPDGTELGVGWINSVALRGQEIEKFDH